MIADCPPLIFLAASAIFAAAASQIFACRAPPTSAAFTPPLPLAAATPGFSPFAACRQIFAAIYYLLPLPY
jgi:hypothetical protein